MPGKALHIRPENVEEDLADKMRKHDCNAFRILSGKSVIHWAVSTDSEGAIEALLEEVERMKRNKTPAIYELHGCRVMEDDDDFREWSPSFEVTFSVWNREDVYYKPVQGYQQNSISKEDLRDAVVEAVNLIREREDTEVDNEDKGVLGYVVDAIKDESTRQAIVGLVGSLIGTIKNAFMNQSQGFMQINGHVGSLPESDFDKVIKDLLVFDPDLLNDLKRLLNLANNNKATFDYVLTQLRQLPL